MEQEVIGDNAAEAIKSYMERVIRLEDEKSSLSADIRDIYAEAKGNGFDVKALRQLVKLAKMDENDRQEQEYMVSVYRKAIGMEFME